MDGKTRDSSADMLNIGEEVSPGSLETDSLVRECTEGVRPNMEEEGVRNGAPLFTPNAEVDITTLAAAFADPECLTAKDLE